MNTKDRLTIGCSAVALVLSIVATVRTELRADQDERRTTRTQLSEVLQRLVSLQLEAVDRRRTAQKDDDIGYGLAASAALGQENGFLIEQAVYLADKIPELVTTYEMNTIATANANAGNFVRAEVFYKKAIDLAPNDLYKSLASRSYAQFLFPQGRQQEARGQFQISLDLLKEEDDQIKMVRGQTFEMWGDEEALFAHSPERANDRFDRAEAEFRATDLEPVRSIALRTLALDRAAPGQSLNLVPAATQQLIGSQTPAVTSGSPVFGPGNPPPAAH